MSKNVIVYVKPHEDGFCAQCKFVKTYLNIKGIEFDEIEGSVPGVADMLKEKGFKSYPVTHIKSKDLFIIGFDRKALDEFTKNEMNNK